MYSDRIPTAAALASASPPAAHARAPGGLIGAVMRLDEAVEQETAALVERRSVDLADFNLRKSHGLLELTRALRGVDFGSLEPELVERVRALRGKLERNRAALDMHLRAAQEIAEIVSAAIRDSDSDGTYGVGTRRASGPAW